MTGVVSVVKRDWIFGARASDGLERYGAAGRGGGVRGRERFDYREDDGHIGEHG